METGMMLAKIFGPFYAIVGLWMLLYGENVVKIMHAIKNSASALYFSSVINLFVGLIVICGYNMWDGNLLIIVTFIGWIMFLRGVLGLYMPQLVVKLLMTHTSWMKTMGVIPFVLGLILIWAGFYM